MKEIIEMEQNLLEMDTDTYMQCKYILLVVSKRSNSMNHFEETAIFQSQIILDRNGYLIDGFTSYLLARKYGIRTVPVRHGRRRIVRASHKPGGKLYSWELPETLVDRVSVGDKAVVRTQKGVRTVVVTAVEEYAGNEPEPLRMVIRVKKADRI